MTAFLAAAVKPFLALLFFFCAYLISRLIWRLLPDGKLRRFLFRRI